MSNAERVIILGAGPVGLGAALELARFGVRSVVIEKHAGTSFHPKTRNFNTRTMEIARGWGRAVYERLRSIDTPPGWKSPIRFTRTAVGEEFAWRGFLQGHVIDRLGQTVGLTCLGLFWSFWHLPSLLSGYNYPDHPVLGALVLFPVTLVAMAFFYGWLTLRARSFWPAALAHGAANSIQIGVISNLKLTVPSLYLDLAGLVVSMLVGLIAWWALSRRQVPAEEAR